MEILLSRGYTEFVRLDAGGQGNVYRTMKGGKLYAVKVVRIEHSRSQSSPSIKSQAQPQAPTVEVDLRRELEITPQLRHPNCIRVLEMFRTRTNVYIVMDFLPCGTIGSKVRKEGPLCEWNVKVWFPGIVHAVLYLHNHQIAHR